jgi:carbon monoxide dehydrogenase subunit G
MKVTGAHVLHAPRQRVWDALQDPAVLVRTIPGCHSLEAVGDGAYSARVHAGVASIKGTYDGRVVLSEQDAPNSYVLRATGSGGPGTIDATATVRLADGDDGTTSVEYDADAVIGGAIGGVGQRVLVGVAKRNATAFFSAVDQYLTGDLAAAEATTGDVAGDAAGARDTVDAADTAPIAPGGRQVFHRPEPAPVQRSSPVELLLAALVGAAIALLGVLVGRRSAR